MACSLPTVYETFLGVSLLAISYSLPYAPVSMIPQIYLLYPLAELN